MGKMTVNIPICFSSLVSKELLTRAGGIRAPAYYRNCSINYRTTNYFLHLLISERMKCAEREVQNMHIAIVNYRQHLRLHFCNTPSHTIVTPEVFGYLTFGSPRVAKRYFLSGIRIYDRIMYLVDLDTI